MSQQMPYAPVPPPMPTPPQQPKNGLGTAALIIGIIGVVLAFFFVGGFLGLLALIFGIVGLGKVKKGEASNKGAAVAGLILGVVAMVITLAMVVFTAVAVDKAVDTLDELEKDAVATAPKDAGAEGGKDKGEKPKKGELLGLGEGMQFDDGLVATVVKVQKYTPGEFAPGHEPGNDAYKVSVEIKNDGDETVDLSLGSVDATAGDEGTPAESIIEDGNIGMFEGSVTPGKKTTQTFAFSVPDNSKNLVLEVSPSWDYEPVFWDLKL
jgi:hypothetical protein